MAQCASVPTKTLYTTLTSTSATTTTSFSVITTPPVVTTITSETCLGTTLGVGVTGCVTTEVEVVSTVDAGGESTIQVPVVIVYPIQDAIPTATQFAPCVDPSPDPGDPRPPSGQVSRSSNDPVSPSSSSTPSTTFITTFITPAPSVITSSISSTLSNGAVVYSETTVTSTLSPVSVVVPDPGPLSSQDQTSSGSRTKDIIGPIVGGILGGFFGLIGTVIFLWYLWRRHKDWIRRAPSGPPDLPQMSYKSRRKSGVLDDSTERKPYEYGTVGRRMSYTSGSTRPGTPGTTDKRRSSVYSQQQSPRSPHYDPRMSLTPRMTSPTALSPGPSLPSTRPPTPGQFYASERPQHQSTPPSAFPSRQSWPQCSTHGEDDRSEHSTYAFGQKRERRPSRLSLTLSTQHPHSDETHPGDVCHGSPSDSRQSTSETGLNRSDTVRSDADVLEEPPRSALYVVNQTKHAASDTSLDAPSAG